MHAGKTVEYWAYGGDFGSFPDDAQFCINGMIWPNREPHPGCFEAKAAMVTLQPYPSLSTLPSGVILIWFILRRVCVVTNHMVMLCTQEVQSAGCQITLIAAGSDDELLLLARRCFASAQTEGSILQHTWQPMHCVHAAAVFQQPFHASLALNSVAHSVPSRPLCPITQLDWKPILSQCGFYWLNKFLFAIWLFLQKVDILVFLFEQHDKWAACYIDFGQVCMTCV